MRTPLIACTGLVFAFVALTGAAGAHPEYEPAIPNRVAPAAPTSCDTCHGPGNTLVLNDFGNLVSAAHTAHGLTYAAWWPDLWQPDADNDGQTNGQELGDPCGTWTMGQPPPRTTNISNPGDLASKSTTPHLPSCPLGGGGAGGTGAASASSGAGSGATSGAGKSSAAGPGDAPPTVQTGACASIAPTSAGGAVAAAWLALGLVAVKRRRRR